MRLTILLAATILTLQTQVKANIHYIDFSKISKDKNLQTQFDKVKDNVQYYNHWTPEWNYETSKEELLKLLEQTYSEFSKIKSSQTELYLLLGTISHYLYNLDKTEYHKNAIENFGFAVANNQKEYRAYWFLGFHYSLSNNPNEAIRNLLAAKDLLPKDEPIDFWENFAFATAIANMPSHSIYAMDKVRTLKGEMGYFESQLGGYAGAC
jgi:tetratricopeptide (TPR) repeat protein